MLERSVTSEVLDGLGPDDPSARRSRRDLRRVHRVMGTSGILTRELGAVRTHVLVGRSPLRVLELGAGDGTLMLRVAQALTPRWPDVQLTLLDRLDLVDAPTRSGYAAIGWTATPRVADVLDWAKPDGSEALALHGHEPAWDLIVANLFLHHFDTAELRVLLEAIARRCRAFVACEPRRSGFALGASRLIGAIGAGAVTRADAVTSVRAGFRAAELSALWPGNDAAWSLTERAAAGFSHCFRAERLAAAAAG